MSRNKALLVLEDGSVFSGRGMGAPGIRSGELVFNTAMTGYQEILTDPSYAGQLVTLTTAHVGNTGVNQFDTESEKIHCRGLIVRHCPRRPSSWRSEQSLHDYLSDHQVSGISDVDTRSLTRHLRRHGCLNACLMVGDSIDADSGLKEARACASMSGLDLARDVTVDTVTDWSEGAAGWSPSVANDDFGRLHRDSKRDFHVVCYDFGAKYTILRLLSDAGCQVTRVPADYPVEKVLALNPDGVMLSNGPGDPDPLDYAIASIRVLLDKAVPVFGICLGHQLLALACGAKTVKMKFGHHGANHPVKDVTTGKVLITSQNHGFAVDEQSLPDHVEPTHRSLFDDTLQGIRLNNRPAFGFQGHPEASPGPHDLRPLFKHFTDMMAGST